MPPIGSMITFFIMLFIILFGSGQTFMLAFGSHMYAFRNVTQSMYSLIRYLLGDFDAEELLAVNPFLAPILFGLFMVLSVFVVLNMFIAIISDAYTETKEELSKKKDLEMSELASLIVEYLLDSLFQIPLLGPVFYRIYEYINKALESSRNRLAILSGKTPKPPSHTRPRPPPRPRTGSMASEDSNEDIQDSEMFNHINQVIAGEEISQNKFRKGSKLISKAKSAIKFRKATMAAKKTGTAFPQRQAIDDDFEEDSASASASVFTKTPRKDTVDSKSQKRTIEEEDKEKKKKDMVYLDHEFNRMKTAMPLELI